MKNKLQPADQKKLDELYLYFEKHLDVWGGYPCNIDFNVEELIPFLKFNMNNLGDPFSGSSYKFNAHAFERDVLDFFAKLYHADENYSGYIASCSTEGNLYGVNIGIKRFPKAVFYYSQAGHYSFPKIARLTQTPSSVVAISKNGEIDYQDLRHQLQKNSDKPAIIALTAGTVMTEAIDQPQKVLNILKELNIKRYHIHCDAAYTGGLLPFIDNAPIINFKEGIDSIVISGHKFLGSPMPCGITLSQFDRNLFSKVEYADLIDTTIGGSRNAFTSLCLWLVLKKIGAEGLKQRAQYCLEFAKKALSYMQGQGIKAWRNGDYATTIVFPRSVAEVVEKWSLLVEGDMAHFVIKSSNTFEQVQQFVADYRLNN